MPPIPCPRCKTPMTQHAVSRKIICPKCDYMPVDRTADRIAAATNLPLTDERHPGRLRGTRLAMAEKVHPRASTAYDIAMRRLQEGDVEKARESFIRALEEQPDLLEAHLQLARLSEDLETKIRHINTIFDYFPRHEETVAYADSLFTEAAATPTPPQRATGEANMTRTMLQCPICGGRLTADRETDEIKCLACGYVQPKRGVGLLRGNEALSREVPAAVVSSTLATATSTQTVRVPWNVGKQLLECAACGNIRTIPSRKVPPQCPFCGSGQLAPISPTNAYQQPDEILTFTVTREQAVEAVKVQVNQLNRAQVRGIVMDGVYVPLWRFRFIIQITGRNGSSEVQEQDRVSQHVSALTIKAFESFEWDWESAEPYVPRPLAEHPAAIYRLDARAGANEAKSIAEDRLYSRYGTLLDAEEKVRYGFAAPHETVPSLSDLKMRFKVENAALTLVPLWVAATSGAQTHRILVHGRSPSITAVETL